MGGSHHTNPPRRKSGVSSVLQRKTLAQAEFSSAEQVKSPKGERPEVRTQQKNHDLSRGFFVGGPDRIRTDDPHNANVMRSQLRYWPIAPPIGGTGLL